MTDYLEVGRGRFWEGGSRVAEMIEGDRGWGRWGAKFNCQVEFSTFPPPKNTNSKHNSMNEILLIHSMQNMMMAMDGINKLYFIRYIIIIALNRSTIFRNLCPNHTKS